MKAGGLALLLLLDSGIAAACPADRAEVRERIAKTEAAWDALDVDAFRREAADLERAVACAREWIVTEDVMRVYLLSTLLAWTARDEERTAQALRALYDVDDFYTLGRRVPEGSELREMAMVAAGQEWSARAEVALGRAAFADANEADKDVDSGRLVLVQVEGEGAYTSWYGLSDEIPEKWRDTGAGGFEATGRSAGEGPPWFDLGGGAWVAAGMPVVTGSVDPSDAATRMYERFDDAALCFGRDVYPTPWREASVELRLRVTGNGVVDSVAHEPADTDPAVGACLDTWARGLHFRPAKDGGAGEIAWTLAFTRR